MDHRDHHLADCKKLGLAFWATVGLVVVFVGYPLSFGPACWISSRTNIGINTLPSIYYPLISLATIDSSQLTEWHRTIVDRHIPSATIRIRSTSTVINWYSRLGSARDFEWKYEFEFSQTPEGRLTIVEDGWKWKEY